MNKSYAMVFILVAFLSMLGTLAFGQKIEEKPELKFQRIFEGLLNNRVSTVFQDKKGFIWAGTYSGLHRYDGLSFQPYTNSPDSSSINNNYIGSIFEDSHNQLWIGTGNGVARYNRDSDDFTRFKLASDSERQAGESFLVNTILEDSKGTLWVASIGSGLFYFDRVRQQFLPYELDEAIAINGMVADKGDIIWLATFQDGLIKLNTTTSKTEYYQHDPADPQSISSDNVKTVAIDRDGRLWAGTRRNGLNRMSIEQGKTSFVRYIHDPADEHSLYNNAIYKLYVDPKGNLWTCNENGGLHLYNKEMDAFYRYLHDPANPSSLTLNSVWNIFQDNQDRYWVGTAQSGIDLADPYSSKFSHYFRNPTNPESLNNDIIRDFLEAKNGDIWVATDGGGLNYFNREKGIFKSYQNDRKNPSSLRSDAVISLNEDPEGRLWVGTWNGGLNLLVDEQKGTFVSFQEWIKNDTYPIRNVFDAHFDEHYVWVAAFDEGLYRYDKRSKELRLFKNTEGDPNSISSNLPVRIFEDSKKNLWIGTNAGLNVIRAEDKEQGIFEVFQPSNSDSNSIPSNSIRQILEDRNGNIWIATDKGLSRYIPNDDTFITYDQADGLPVNEITSIVEDDLGFLWIGSIKGISKFDPVNKIFTNFDRADGLQGNEFSRYSVLKTRKGELVFGGMNGFNLFDPANLTSNVHAPQVYLTDLKLFNKSVDFKSPDAPLQNHISTTDTLRLSHRENVVSFDFIALNYSDPQHNQYAYFLEGFEEEWNYVGTQRNATYTNLNPGTYVFRVKAANSDGVWNETGTSLVLIISPPFWKTVWFIVSASLVVISLLVLAYKMRVRTINERNRQLENTVKERTTMLQHANADLKKHIDEKDKLLGIIGHDLRNPFFSIIGYMELLEDEFKNTENSEHLENIQYLLNVSRNTHNLLENLLQWAIKETTIFDVKAQMINMSQMVNTAMNMVSSQADYKKIILEKSCAEDIFIHADQNMILTVLRNLISNAIKFSDENSKIEILVSQKSGEIVTSVRDHGTGMDEAALSRLFSKSNAQQPGTMGEVGTGLGLVLCQEILQKHEGEIWAESTLGKGSTFSFSLSRHEPADVAV